MATRGRKLGTKLSNIQWLHVTITMKPYEWERINYLCADSGKNLSGWVVSKIASHKGTVTPRVVKDDGEKMVVKPLCVPADFWQKVKEMADANGMKVSPFVMSILME